MMEKQLALLNGVLLLLDTPDKFNVTSMHSVDAAGNLSPAIHPATVKWGIAGAITKVALSMDDDPINIAIAMQVSTGMRVVADRLGITVEDYTTMIQVVKATIVDVHDYIAFVEGLPKTLH